MTMLLRRRPDPIQQLAERLREVGAQLRVDAYKAQRAADAHKRAASDQIEIATSLAAASDEIDKAESLASEGEDDA